MSKEKERALKELQQRRERNAKKERISNGFDPDAPIIFYCKSCGGLSDLITKTYVVSPEELCEECKKMKEKGWLE